MRESLDFEKIIYRDNIKETDINFVAEIIKSSNFFSSQENEIAVELIHERLVKGVHSGYYFLFAEFQEEVIGYICFGPVPGTEYSFDIYWIAVHNNLRQMGIGKKLLAKAEEIIMRMGGRHIYIETSSREQYGPTRMFYEKHNYKEVGCLENYYSTGDNKIIYLKKLFEAIG